MVMAVWTKKKSVRCDEITRLRHSCSFLSIGHILKLIYELNRCGTSKEEITPEIRARQIIDQFDLDGDRKLSRDEFFNGCLNDPELRKLLTP